MFFKSTKHNLFDCFIIFFPFSNFLNHFGELPICILFLFLFYVWNIIYSSVNSVGEFTLENQKYFVTADISQKTSIMVLRRGHVKILKRQSLSLSAEL